MPANLLCVDAGCTDSCVVCFWLFDRGLVASLVNFVSALFYVVCGNSRPWLFSPCNTGGLSHNIQYAYITAVILVYLAYDNLTEA